ncbi:MAG: hypothetical protein SFU98_19125 [Leptospiraceae bacterium]|nr:hypothetical protein [Leptospiraceae bacterium]
MKQFAILIILLLSFSVLNDFLQQLSARPGGGSSYRSSSSSSRSSSSSSRSSSSGSSWSSSRSSSSSYSGGGGGGDIDPNTIGFLMLSVFGFPLAFAFFPDKSKGFQLVHIALFATGIAFIIFAAYLSLKGTAVGYFAGMFFFLGPFLLIYFIFKQFTGNREEIYVAKGK